MRIPAKYGIYQVVGDTGGPAGMMMGLRSIPAYMPICREMEKRAPRAILFNHSNPMAALCRAMHKYTGIDRRSASATACRAASCTPAELLGLDPRELEATWIGTNHYYWFTGLRHQGRDLCPELLQRFRSQPYSRGQRAEHAACRSSTASRSSTPRTTTSWSSTPSAAGVRDMAKPPYGLDVPASHHGFDPEGPSAERPAQTPELRREFLGRYGQILDGQTLPQEQGDRITSEGIGSLLSAIATGRREVCDRQHPQPRRGPQPAADGRARGRGRDRLAGRARIVTWARRRSALKGLLEKRIAWQELVADAAVKGDRNLALQALLLDEMAIVPEKAEAMLDELLAASATCCRSSRNAGWLHTFPKAAPALRSRDAACGFSGRSPTYRLRVGDPPPHTFPKSRHAPPAFPRSPAELSGRSPTHAPKRAGSGSPHLPESCDARPLSRVAPRSFREGRAPMAQACGLRLPSPSRKLRRTLAFPRSPSLSFR